MQAITEFNPLIQIKEYEDKTTEKEGLKLIPILSEGLENINKLKIDFKKFNYIHEENFFQYLQKKEQKKIKYEDEKNKLYKKLSKKFTLSQLFFIASSEEYKRYVDLVNKICKFQIREFEKVKSYKGFFWKATKSDPNNPNKDISHYLIGTIHILHIQIANDNRINQCLKSSDQIFSETGEAFWMRLFHKLINLCKIYSPDMEIIEKFYKEKKVIQRLDHDIHFIDKIRYLFSVSMTLIFRKLSIFFLQWQYPSIKPKSKLWYNDVIQRLYYLQMHQQYVKGDNFALKECREKECRENVAKHKHDETADRNKEWFEERILIDKKNCYKGLKEYLSKSSSPVSIIAGLNHMYGDYGLVEEFRKLGFKLERL